MGERVGCRTILSAVYGSLKGELPCPTALGATRPSLVEDRASCFCVGTCTRRGQRGSRLRRRFPFTGSSECPTPTESTLGPHVRCTLVVVVRKARRAFRDDETASPFRTTFEQRTRRGEHLTTPFDDKGSKRIAHSECEPCGRCIPSLLASSTLVEEGGLPPSIMLKPRLQGREDVNECRLHKFERCASMHQAIRAHPVALRTDEPRPEC